MPATDRPTPSTPGPWPVKPGLKLIPESRLDHRPDQEILSSLQEYRPVSGEKNIWAFWHCGLSSSPQWVQRTVINWVRRLPTWSVRVLDSIPGSPTHFHHYITPALLPDALNNNTMTGPYVSTHSSDLIRLPLLYLYGGLWMDVGTLLFRDLDDICWSKLEDPRNPYEIAGFTLPHGGTAKKKTLLNSFIAARKGNPFVKRWHDIFLEVWRGVSECKGMHAHPLLKSIHPADPTENDDTESKVPWSPSMPTEVKQDLADYGAQIICFDRLLLLEDPSDGFSGSDYLAKHALFFDGMQEATFFQQLTGWDGLLQYQHLITKKIPQLEEGLRNQRYLAAEQFAESVVRDSCQMKVSHGILSLGIRMLGRVWEEPGNEDADCAEGTFAAYLRYASGFLEQTRVMEAQKVELSTRKRMRVGLLEVGKTSLSRPASLRSSIDEGPSKAPSTTKSGQLRALGSSQPILTHESSYETSQATSNSLTSNPSASAHAIPFGSLQTTSVKPYRTHPRDPSPHFSQKSSGISKLSPSFVTAHGELHAPGSGTDIEENRGCVGQMDIVDGPRGPKNPHGLSHDNSIGYLSKGFEVMLGTAGQTDTTQSNDPPSFDDLLRMIAAERLQYMPQKGSNWDRSIRALESFAFKVSGYAGRYTSVVSNSQFTATMLYGRSSVLLQLGRNRVASLVPALGMLAAMSSGLSLFASFPSRPTISSQLQQHLGQILDRTLDLLNGITSCFQDIPIGLDAATGPSLLRRSLHKQLEAFDLQAAQLLSEMWNSYIPSDVQEPILKFEQVQSLLQPQDEVVRMTQKILLADKGTRHEFSCEWLSEQFLDFVRSSDSTLWIDGSIGCGKSVLCGWILESLQSPINGREYAVIAYAIDPLLPSEANTACVIKALLRQLVERRYGSSNVCRALAKLSSTLTTTDFPVQNDNALLECLQITIGDVIQPTMLVIDGLSELDGVETAATALFHALLNCVAGNPLVRLLVLSRPFEFFPVTPLRRKTIQASDVLMDIHNVITDLVPSHTKTPSVEIARKITHEADGSFLWSLLTLQDWAAHDFSLQMWNSLPTSLDANIASLVSKIDLSDLGTCGVLFNVVIAIRPLRVAEIEFISRLDVNNQTLKPQAPDVKRAVEDACGSMLIIQDGIVLFRHVLLKQVLLETLQFGILSLGPEMHGDMACRLLFYIKLVLGQRSELTLKSIPSSTMADLLRSHPLLSYALRYWTRHVVASGMYNGSSFKPSSDCKTVFPDSIYAATVEASFWTQNVSCESIQALKIAASARKEILGNNEATMQTVVFLAEALRIAKDYGGAVVNSALAFELSQLILPVSHPFAAACMLQFLNGSDLDVLKQPDSNQFAAVPALRRLIDIYSREQSWDQASEAYACLWNAFLVKDDLDFSPFRALFVEYTGFLKRRKSDKVHEIIVSYRAACLANFGERDPVTLEASLLLAESWNNGYPDSTSIEAVRLYEGIVDGDEGYSPQGIALVEVAEERLAKIYEADINGHYMQGETLLRAVRLQGKKYQTGKIREGASQPATLSSLAVWVSMLTKQNSPDSKAVAVREMQSAVESVIESDAQPTSLYSTAVILANLFAANGYVEEGLTTMQSLTEQALFEQDETEQQAGRSILFLAAFEAHLTGSMVDFAGIHARLLMVSALWDSYKRLSQEGTQPEAMLACGAKLRSFLLEHNFHHRGALIEDDLFQRFQDYYGATSAIREFFCSMLPELSSERLHIDIPDLASNTFYQYVSSFLEQGDYQSALNLGLSGFDFVCFVGGFATNLEKGLELGLKLAHTDVVQAADQAVAAQMMDLSKRLLQETLRECRSQNFNFNMMNIDFVSRIASVLGLQQNYEDLEWLLTRLWLSRKNLTSISPDIIVTIGRRLVEVRFFHGHIDSAIELGEDILYNVQRVYGTSHPSTVDIANFLSSIYVANGDEAAASAVVGDVSHLKVPGTKGHSTKFDQPKTVNAAKPNIGYLLQFYHRNNDAEKSTRSTGRVQRLSEEIEDSRDAGDVVRTGQQPPASWGFIDRSGERVSRGIEPKG